MFNTVVRIRYAALTSAAHNADMGTAPSYEISNLKYLYPEEMKGVGLECSGVGRVNI